MEALLILIVVIAVGTACKALVSVRTDSSISYEEICRRLDIRQ